MEAFIYSRGPQPLGSNAWWSEVEVIIKEKKCTINVMRSNHPETVPHTPRPGKINFHKTSPWCPKEWGLLREEFKQLHLILALTAASHKACSFSVNLNKTKISALSCNSPYSPKILFRLLEQTIYPTHLWNLTENQNETILKHKN